MVRYKIDWRLVAGPRGFTKFVDVPSKNEDDEGMKINRFRSYLLSQGAVVLGVILAFAVIPDKKIASLVASSLFVLSSVGILIYETRFATVPKSRLVIFSTAAFVVLFILPIILMRLTNWETDFQEIRVLGVSARAMHQASNYAFMLMLVTYFVEILRRAQNKKDPV